MASYVVIDQAQLSAALADLRSYEGPEMDARIRKATLAGAQSLKGPVSDAAPRKTGGLARSIRVAQIKDNGGWIGYRVGPGRNSPTNLESLVVGGTRPHTIYGKVGKELSLPVGPRAVVHSPGTRPNPFVARIASEEGPTVLAAMAKSIAAQAKRAGF